MQTVTIEGKIREVFGKNASKTLRRNENIPCVLNGGGTSINFIASEKDLINLVYTPNFYKVHVVLGDQTHEALMQEIQFHPVTDKVLHIDFLKLDPKKKVTTEVPVKCTGQSAGVRAGAKLVQKLRKLTIKAYPKDLLDVINIDVTELEVGKSIRIEDIKLPNIEILGAGSMPIVSCLVPRVMKVEEEKPAATTAAAAPTADAAKTDEKAKEEKKDKK
jgi:large subunit ribosomal protein L25